MDTPAPQPLCPHITQADGGFWAKWGAQAPFAACKPLRGGYVDTGPLGS